MNNVFTVKQCWPVNNSQVVLANLIVNVAEAVDVKVSLLNSKQGKGPWVKLPQDSYTKDNQTHYVDLVKPVSSLQALQLKDVVLKAFIAKTGRDDLTEFLPELSSGSTDAMDNSANNPYNDNVATSDHIPF